MTGHKLYRMAWKSKITGAMGYGTGLFPKEQAEMIADELNKEDTICVHWAEYAPPEPAQAVEVKGDAA